MLGGVRAVPLILILLAGCSRAPLAERLSADAARRTARGVSFTAPAGWSIATRGPATVLEAPERGSWIALVDVRAADADAAVAAAWAAYRPGPVRPVKSVTAEADRDGWREQRTVRYQTSPGEKRTVMAGAKRQGEDWTVWIYDMQEATAEKRLGQVALILNRLLPPGHQRETFAARQARPIDAAALSDFVERGRALLGVPGVAVGVVQQGRVVLARGYGVRTLGQSEAVDADTLFLIASNTKPLTTLLLASLVDEGQKGVGVGVGVGWDTPVTQVFPTFRLGDDETTRRVLLRHLVCACTGLPRQDAEWLLEFGALTPARVFDALAAMRPTSKLGEMYQYSNALAAAGGYVAARVANPGLELGAAYDAAMQARVFGPLGMNRTTFDFDRALAGNHASPHALTIDGQPAPAVMEANRSIIPVRPAGGAWSNVRDLLKYVSMELARGALPDGRRYLSEATLLERRVPQVAVGKDLTYGMGLRVDTSAGVPVVRHGGSMVGYRSDLFWLPEQGVGATILTNSSSATALLGPFRRKLLELLFDGEPRADEELMVAARNMRQRMALDRKALAVPAAADGLAPRYRNDALGTLDVTRGPGGVTFDFGEWKSPVASRRNSDGSVSFVTIVPGMTGLEFLASAGGLLYRDAQHDYLFTPAP
jgi:CubicO group peptidase (beta-lactamase class C family)